MECGIAFRENELKCVQKGLSDKINRRIDMVFTKRNRIIDISHLIKQKDPLTLQPLRRSLFDFNEKKPEVNPLDTVYKAFESNIHYTKRFKQRHMEENHGPEAIEIDAENDPRIKYMKKCLENLDSILPVFDKIFNKTLCLQNYLLNDGHCQGLSDACENLDPRIVNRMLFNNCGLSGDQMAVLLDGFAKMTDLKALIYKNN